MIDDISQEIIQMRRAINQLEMLNSNPYLTGKKQLYDTTLELQNLVQMLAIKVADYALDNR